VLQLMLLHKANAAAANAAAAMSNGVFGQYFVY
jgi:hypothetical protein